MSKRKSKEDGSIKVRLRQKGGEKKMLFEDGELECSTGIFFVPELGVEEAFGVKCKNPDMDTFYTLDLCMIFTLFCNSLAFIQQVMAMLPGFDDGSFYLERTEDQGFGVFATEAFLKQLSDEDQCITGSSLYNGVCLIVKDEESPTVSGISSDKACQCNAILVTDSKSRRDGKPKISILSRKAARKMDCRDCVFPVMFGWNDPFFSNPHVSINGLAGAFFNHCCLFYTHDLSALAMEHEIMTQDGPVKLIPDIPVVVPRNLSELPPEEQALLQKLIKHFLALSRQFTVDYAHKLVSYPWTYSLPLEVLYAIFFLGISPDRAFVRYNVDIEKYKQDHKQAMKPLKATKDETRVPCNCSVCTEGRKLKIGGKEFQTSSILVSGNTWDQRSALNYVGMEKLFEKRDELRQSLLKKHAEHQAGGVDSSGCFDDSTGRCGISDDLSDICDSTGRCSIRFREGDGASPAKSQDGDSSGNLDVLIVDDGSPAISEPVSLEVVADLPIDPVSLEVVADLPTNTLQEQGSLEGVDDHGDSDPDYEPSSSSEEEDLDDDDEGIQEAIQVSVPPPPPAAINRVEASTQASRRDPVLAKQLADEKKRARKEKKDFLECQWKAQRDALRSEGLTPNSRKLHRQNVKRAKPSYRDAVIMPPFSGSNRLERRELPAIEYLKSISSTLPAVGVFGAQVNPASPAGSFDVLRPNASTNAFALRDLSPIQNSRMSFGDPFFGAQGSVSEQWSPENFDGAAAHQSEHSSIGSFHSSMWNGGMDV